MASDSKIIAAQLGARAEETCRHYLSNGRRSGAYWIVGDKLNAKGRSLFVRLRPIGGAPAGKWTDAATGEHGDLLDIIASVIGAASHREALAEAKRFLGVSTKPTAEHQLVPRDGAAARLFAAAQPLSGTLGARYLAARGVDPALAAPAVRVHPRCYLRDGDERCAAPALIAAVRDDAGAITGVMRTYLNPTAPPMVRVRKALGRIRGKGVQFGSDHDILLIAEGVETALSLRTALPAMTTVAALSAAHLALWTPPPRLKRILIATDRDAAGLDAAERLTRRLRATGVDCATVLPQRNDFNDDLLGEGRQSLRDQLLQHLSAEDRARFAPIDRRLSPSPRRRTLAEC